MATKAPLVAGVDPKIFVYDNYPGGIGFSAPLFRMQEDLLRATRELVTECECDAGCPSCVGPIGETGPLAKRVAIELLDLIGPGPALANARRDGAMPMLDADRVVRSDGVGGGTLMSTIDRLRELMRNNRARRRRRRRAAGESAHPPRAAHGDDDSSRRCRQPCAVAAERCGSWSTSRSTRRACRCRRATRRRRCRARRCWRRRSGAASTSIMCSRPIGCMGRCASRTDACHPRT